MTCACTNIDEGLRLSLFMSWNKFIVMQFLFFILQIYTLRFKEIIDRKMVVYI